MSIIRTRIRARLWAALRQRCPRCCRGRIFASGVRMNEECPVCGLRFGRESGYFFGSMYVSYLLSIPALGLLTVAGHLLFPQISLVAIVLLAAAAALPLVPVLFRYSRVLWIHFDRWADPVVRE